LLKLLEDLAVAKAVIELGSRRRNPSLLKEVAVEGTVEGFQQIHRPKAELQRM